MEDSFILTVVDVSHAPVALNDAVTMSEDNIAAIFMLSNDTDADGDLLGFVIETPPTVGSLLSFSDHVGYIPPANFHGTASFTYRATDGALQSNIGTVIITVTPVNDGPVAAPDTLAINEDTAGIVAILANDRTPTAIHSPSPSWARRCTAPCG